MVVPSRSSRRGSSCCCDRQPVLLLLLVVVQSRSGRRRRRRRPRRQRLQKQASGDDSGGGGGRRSDCRWRRRGGGVGVGLLLLLLRGGSSVPRQSAVRLGRGRGRLVLVGLNLDGHKGAGPRGAEVGLLVLRSGTSLRELLGRERREEVAMVCQLQEVAREEVLVVLLGSVRGGWGRGRGRGGLQPDWLAGAGERAPAGASAACIEACCCSSRW